MGVNDALGISLGCSQDLPLVGVAALHGGFLVGDDEGAAALVGLVAVRCVPEQGAEEHDGAGACGKVNAVIEIDFTVYAEVAGAALFVAGRLQTAVVTAGNQLQATVFAAGVL